MFKTALCVLTAVCLLAPATARGKASDPVFDMIDIPEPTRVTISADGEVTYHYDTHQWDCILFVRTIEYRFDFTRQLMDSVWESIDSAEGI